MSSNTQAPMPTTMLNEQQWSQLHTAIQPLSREQLTWVSGYLAGLAQNQVAVPGAAVQTDVQPAAKLTILYGSQTGNAKGVAQEYHAKVTAAGLSASLMNMADYKPKQLKHESHIAIVVSTHGEGEAPDDAVELHEFLDSKKATKLSNLKYSVLGLGDSSYEFFCQTAKDFDERLQALGAQRAIERVDCDVDYDADVARWSDELTSKFEADLKGQQGSQVVPLPGVAHPGLAVAKQNYSKKHPFTASLSETQQITGRDSVKHIAHVEISLEDSGMQYQPGDALGVFFDNDPLLAEELLDLLAISNEEKVHVHEQNINVLDALVKHLELTQSYPTFVQQYAELTDNSGLKALTQDKAKLRDYLSQRQIVDIVREYPGKLTAQQLVDSLRGITPRLYSIASSQAEVEDEVHLTVALVEDEVNGHVRFGGASGFLANRVEAGGEVRVFVEENNNFRLPEEADTPVIMVGPGTGIAPFRAFMQQRADEQAKGKNWLFFGNPNFTQDFLYQTEWQRFVKDGVLSKISLAFSRDQEQKVYVQHRLLENGEEVYQWLEQGAHFYVCGDANRMAKDVHDALIAVVQKHGNKSKEQAEQYVNELRKAKRYQRDVY